MVDKAISFFYFLCYNYYGDNMDTKEKIKLANQILNNNGQQVKVLKTDNSLIERTLSSRVIITEDNRELLRD